MKCLPSGHSLSSHTSNALFRFGYEGFLKWIYPLSVYGHPDGLLLDGAEADQRGPAFECIDPPWTFLSSSVSRPSGGASLTGHIHVKVLCAIAAQIRRPTTPLKPRKSWIRAGLFSLQLLFWSILSQWQKSNEPNPSSTDRDVCVGSSRAVNMVRLLLQSLTDDTHLTQHSYAGVFSPGFYSNIISSLEASNLSHNSHILLYKAEQPSLHF